MRAIDPYHESLIVEQARHSGSNSMVSLFIAAGID
jgi:hypothetical protein